MSASNPREDLAEARRVVVKIGTKSITAGEAGRWRLRWFTPTVEVPLCGHATLASAHVIWQERLAGLGDEIRFSTRCFTWNEAVSPGSSKHGGGSVPALTWQWISRA